jgi:cysteinyl-tRNA synthetase
VDDLLAKGFKPRQIRFFLLYGPYRESLDLRTSTLDERAGRLARIRHLARRALGEDTQGSKTDGPDPAAAMQADFESRMNDDLDYAGAFDAVAEHLTRAAAASAEGRLDARRRRRMTEVIGKVDSVLGVFGDLSCVEAASI